MSVVIVVGAQWGDEGKGKVVDLFAESADVIVRYGGGANAGHTLVINGQKLVTHLVPSGVLHPGKQCILGDGMVIDPDALLGEIADCQARGLLQRGELLVGRGAHVILPYHKLLDGLREDAAKKTGRAIGTTRRGIGPAYEAKAARRGVRIADLSSRERLRTLVQANIDEWGPLIRHLGGNVSDADIQAWTDAGLRAGERLASMAGDASLAVANAVRSGKHVLFEGAQGSLLDLDHGTYPYVTSSSTIAAGACQSAGVGPTVIDEVVGISKAYATRVGEGPFPTELQSPTGELMRQRGAEFGATTGRPRRCGWLDAAALRLGVRLSGMSSVALTKLDVLSTMGDVSVCVGYRLGGRVLDEPPRDLEELGRSEPVFQTFPGWSELPSACRNINDLPANARRYVDAVRELIGVPLSLISVGPDRNQTISLMPPFGAT